MILSIFQFFKTAVRSFKYKHLKDLRVDKQHNPSAGKDFGHSDPSSQFAFIRITSSFNLIRKSLQQKHICTNSDVTSPRAS